MHDTRPKPDHEALFETAASQSGYFTAKQAHEAGLSDPLVSHHTRRGRFQRIVRGVYRIRDFPSTPHEEVVAAWLAQAPHGVVSHESALDLLGLADTIPNAIHITIPRARRRPPRMQGVALHTTTRPLDGEDVITREGIRLTSPTRTLVDTAESGTAPEQVVAASARAIRLGMTTPDKLLQAIESASPRAASLLRMSLVGQVSQRYPSASAFRRALETRLLTLSRTTSRSLARLRKEVVFDRLLARLLANTSERWVLKGGLALDYRFGDRARTTKDIDLALEGDEASATNALLAAQAADLGDFFVFAIERTPDADPTGDGSAIRYHVRAELDGRRFDEFVLDIGFDPPVETDTVRGVNLLAFAGLEPLVADAIPLEVQIAEKVHAYTRMYGSSGRTSTRVKDLLDIQMISIEATVNAERIRRAIDDTFERRASHRPPDHLPPPPLDWRTPYAKLAKEVGLPTGLNEGYVRAAALIDPVLDGTASGMWDARSGQWSNSGAGPRTTPAAG